MQQEYRDSLISLAPLAILFVFNLFIDSVLFLYDAFPYLDVPMHFFGGYLTALTVYENIVIHKKRFKINIKPAAFLYMFIVGATALVAIAWEVYEWAHDQIYPRIFLQGTGDIVSDLVLGIGGALIYCFVLSQLAAHLPAKPISRKRR